MVAITLQRNIYQMGNRIYVKKTVYSEDKQLRKVAVLPCLDLNHALEVLDDLLKHDCSLSYSIELEKECRTKCGLPEEKKGQSDESNIYRENNRWIVSKEINSKKLTWKCDSHEEARLLRDKLKKNNWKLPADRTKKVPKRPNTKKYGRFEEVKELPRLHIPKKPKEKVEKTTVKVEKPKEVVEKPKDKLILQMAKRYSISYEDMSQLCLMIGLQQLNKLNFIPEYGD